MNRPALPDVSAGRRITGRALVPRTAARAVPIRPLQMVGAVYGNKVESMRINPLARALFDDDVKAGDHVEN
jgi:hypothetical protein